MYLTNFSNSDTVFHRFNHDWNELKAFSETHQLDGIELILHGQKHLDSLPEDLVHGMHLRCFPSWLDFWKGDLAKVRKELKTDEMIKMYYGGLERTDLVKLIQEEVAIVKQLNVKYIVFHVSHVEVEHTFNRAFSYTDWDVLEASVELINEVFGEEGEIDLLFENLWWPGLTFLDPDLTKKFMDGIKYKNKGFMLDLSHLMITNSALRTQKEAADYIIETVEGLGALKAYIKGVHINHALPGEYMEADHTHKLNHYKTATDDIEKYRLTMEHIRSMDWHQPFDDRSIRDVIECIQPKYKVFEFLPEDNDEMSRYLTAQNEAIR